MGEYRLYFLDPRGEIQAREEFAAPDDETALRICAFVYDACSDSSFDWSLSRGSLQLQKSNAHGPGRAVAAELSQDMQHRVLELEETIQRSRWMIAKSTKLLERTAQLRDTLDTRQK